MKKLLCLCLLLVTGCVPLVALPLLPGVVGAGYAMATRENNFILGGDAYSPYEVPEIVPGFTIGGVPVEEIVEGIEAERKYPLPVQMTLSQLQRFNAKQGTKPYGLN